MPEEDAQGKKLRGSLDPDDHETLLDIWSGIREGEFPRGVDLRMRRPDGSSRIVSCAFSALSESEGDILVSFRDVTIGLVQGHTGAALVDTGSTLAEARSTPTSGRLPDVGLRMWC